MFICASVIRTNITKCFKHQTPSNIWTNEESELPYQQPQTEVVSSRHSCFVFPRLYNIRIYPQRQVCAQTQKALSVFPLKPVGPPGDCRERWGCGSDWFLSVRGLQETVTQSERQRGRVMAEESEWKTISWKHSVDLKKQKAEPRGPRGNRHQALSPSINIILPASLAVSLPHHPPHHHPPPSFLISLLPFLKKCF